MAKEWDGTRSPFDAAYEVRSDAFRDCIDAIKGAIAFGQQGVNPAPEGHWLAEFWGIGRKLAASPADQGEDARDAARYRKLKALVDTGGRAGEYIVTELSAADWDKELDAQPIAAMSASKEGA